MKATVVKAYKGVGSTLVFSAEGSGGELVDVAAIRTFADAALFFRRHTAVTSIQHGEGDAPTMPPPAAFPEVLPNAVRHAFPSGATYTFPKGFPESIVIGGMGSLGKGVGVVDYLRNLGLQAVVILRDGTTHQIGTLTSYGKTVAGATLNIVPECDGCVLKKAEGHFENYFTGIRVPAEEVRYRNGKYYHVFTQEQEKRLVDICVWMIKQSKGLITPDSIIGLQEAISVDAPGGSSQYSMPDFRTVIRAVLGEEK